MGDRMRMPSQMGGAGMNPNMMMMGAAGGMKQGGMPGNMMGMPGMVGASNNAMPGGGSWPSPPTAMSSPQHRQSPGLAPGGGPPVSQPGTRYIHFFSIFF